MLLPMNVPTSAGLTPSPSSLKGLASAGFLPQAATNYNPLARVARRFEHPEAPDRGHLHHEAPDAGLRWECGGRGGYLSCDNGHGRSRS